VSLLRPGSHPPFQVAQPVGAAYTVVIADGHSLVASGLAKLISATHDFSVIDTCPTPDALTEALRVREPHALVLDIDMPGLSPFALLRRLRQHQPGMAVLVVSGLPGEVYAMRVVEAGARGFLSKRADVDTLLRALRSVVEGNLWIHGEWAAPAFRRRRWSSLGRHPLSMSYLTSRELEVFRLLGDGKSPREVGQALHVSHRTVASHRLRIYQKLGIRSLGELIHLASEYRRSQDRDGSVT